MLWKIRTLAFVVSTLALIAGTPLGAQTLGNPLISTGGTGSNSSPAYIDAYIQTGGATGGTDVCLRIQSVYNSTLIPAGGSGTVDARGFTGTGWTCSVNPFANTAGTGLTGKSGKLLLGYIDIPASVTWVIPGHVILQGIGTNGTGLAGANTIIHASSTGFSKGLGSALAVLQMWLGGTTPNSQAASYGIQIRDLTVDCNGSSTGGASVGVLNNNAEEGSLLNNVQIFDCPGIGLHVTTNNPNSKGHGAVNSGPYQDVFINYSACGNCGTASIPLQVDGDTTSAGTSNEGRSIRGFDNFTVSGNNLTNIPANLIYVYGVSTAITNSHAEYCTGGCIFIGQNPAVTSSGMYSTTGVQLSGITVGNNNLSWDVVIGSAGNTGTYPVGNVIIEELNHESINAFTVQDNVTGNVVPDNYLGWYFLGNGTTPAVFTSSSSMTGSGTPYELKIPGNVDVIGTLTKPGGSFRIDHPLDPANEYLYHSFVESPDMMNIYNGSVTTDKRGMATVTLPDYFEALNQDFRYQLTPMGQFAQAFVAEKVKGNRFVIKTNKPGVEVSWQVTGIRHDTYANQHRIRVEERKPESLRSH